MSGEKESEGSFLKNIKSSFEEGQIYTQLTEDTVLAVNPNKIIGNENSIAEKFLTAFSDETPKPTAELPPHLIGLAMNSYKRLKRLHDDQYIAFL
jgi:myosin heavy subunit